MASEFAANRHFGLIILLEIAPLLLVTDVAQDMAKRNHESQPDWHHSPSANHLVSTLTGKIHAVFQCCHAFFSSCLFVINFFSIQWIKSYTFFPILLTVL